MSSETITKPSEYVEFYLRGYEAMAEDSVDVDDVDLAPSIDKIMAGSSVYDCAQEIATSVMAPLHLRDRKQFNDDEGLDIKEMGLDAGKAFEAWMRGRTDELRRSIEAQLMEGLLEEMDGGEEDEEEDDEDESDGPE